MSPHRKYGDVRRAVVRFIESIDDPFTVPDVVEQMGRRHPDLNADTVRQTLYNLTAERRLERVPPTSRSPIPRRRTERWDGL